jgi:hypothetical protein
VVNHAGGVSQTTEKKERIAMALKDTIEKSKPFGVGIIAGIVLTLIVGFSMGWIVTAGTKDQAIRTVQVDRLSAICAAQAKNRWQAQGEELTTLHGWQNRQQRETLATEVSTTLLVEEAIQRDVVWQCTRLLDA